MLRLSSGVIRVLLVLNILLGAVLVGVGLLTFVYEQSILLRLVAEFPGEASRTALVGVRWALLLVVPVAVAAHVVFTRLLAILRTVEAGDPFLSENGGRLRAIAWALLAIQLCDLAYGAVALRVDTALGERFSGWTPGITGWLAVLLTFVLARVFREGAAMRDDLALTV